MWHSRIRNLEKDSNSAKLKWIDRNTALSERDNGTKESMNTDTQLPGVIETRSEGN